MSNNSLVIPSESIVNKIYIIRNRKVMLDRDLAELYGVTTGNLNLAVKRDEKLDIANCNIQCENQGAYGD